VVTSAALMELGALVCTARAPRCDDCPLAAGCAWLAADRPPPLQRRRTQSYAGTDRQVRGAMLALLRDSSADGLSPDVLLGVCPDPQQAARALAGLVADGLVVRGAGAVRLPG
jgi:A/G-specific adenine glycosylase